jgi:hypothetical protein
MGKSVNSIVMVIIFMPMVNAFDELGVKIKITKIVLSIVDEWMTLIRG